MYSNTARKEQDTKDANHLVTIYLDRPPVTSSASPASAPPACCMDSDCARAALPVVGPVAAAAAVDVGVGDWAVGVEDWADVEGSVDVAAAGSVTVAQPCAWKRDWDCGRYWAGEVGEQGARQLCPCDWGSAISISTSTSTSTSTLKVSATAVLTGAQDACRVCLGLCCACWSRVCLVRAHARQG
jgi:hypothetical protein